jgi:molybdopterin adenylyltransferase
MGTVIAVCSSEKKGTQKQAIHSAQFVQDWGMEGDAHAGNWHRQVSLLSFDKIEAFRSKGANVENGAFGENLAVEGIDFRSLPLGTRFTCNDVILELTQIGKECHAHCAIYQQVGDCIMPREGVFSKVIQGGTISEGDEMRFELPFRVAVVTASDSGAAGNREDVSGPVICEIVKQAGYQVACTSLLPDDRAQLAQEFCRLCDELNVDLVLTTGGTGFSPRDFTPEATKDVIEREVPGIPEAMRALSLQITPRAMLTRAAAGIRGKTLIVNLPGSPKAVKECLDYILPPLAHGLEILRGTANNCAR